MKRRADIDLLKGIAILAVVLYHIGFLKSGYLGVDIFFAIGGFLTVPTIVERVRGADFHYFTWLKRRVMRLLPLILIASVICLAIGYFLWLPDDFENLSESVIASTFFSNNILSGITTKNYWNTINEFKPLMHTWYIGILMEFYIVVPLIVIFLNKAATLLNRDAVKIIGGGVLSLSFLSLGLFLYPRFSEGTKFYFIPFRFYELAAGGLAGLYAKRLSKKEVFNNRWLAPLAFLLLLAALNIGIIRFDIHQIGVHTAIIGENVVQKNALLLPNQALVIIVVLLSCLYLLTGAQYHISGGGKILTAIGKRSYSIFIWHQVLLALYRYSFSNKLSIGFVAGFFAVLAGISEISYRFAEQSIGITKKSVLCTGLCAVLICGMSGMIYLHAGVVRDVPELGIKKTEVHRNMHAQYCDRVFQYDHDYTEDQKTKVLIIGNSFARDFGNILLESEYADDVDISYASNYSEDLAERIRQADRIFIFGDKNNVPDYLWESVSDVDKVYGIGTKNFGLTNGNIYAHRFSKTYFDQTVSLDPGYKALDDRWKREWGDHYVAMIDPVLKDSNVRVFTDDHMYISQDCAHLTQGGARYYARILDLKSLLF